jgi:hypothetical protein
MAGVEAPWPGHRELTGEGGEGKGEGKGEEQGGVARVHLGRHGEREGCRRGRHGEDLRALSDAARLLFVKELDVRKETGRRKGERRRKRKGRKRKEKKKGGKIWKKIKLEIFQKIKDNL